MSPSNDADRLARSLQRMDASLSRVGAHGPAPQPAPAHRPTRSRGPAVGLVSASTALLVLALATGHPQLLLASLALLVLGGAVLFTDVGKNLLGHLPGVQRDPTRPSIGMGASVAGDATIEPGASVEMGASVGAGAIVRRGAVVRMGSSIGPGAVLETGAVVSWGADVGAGAVVGADAIVGAGASVAAKARVPARARLLPGATFSTGSGHAAPPLTEADPRHARIDAACDRLEADLLGTPENLRQFLGAPGQTVAALRSTCHDLLHRESALRAEASPEAFTRLEQEKAAIAARAAAALDPAVRRSLEGALAAIDDQQRQRGVLRSTAERLDAESTRLVLTLEGMSAQIVRLRSASAGVLTPADAPALAGSVKLLQDEIEAVAEALEGLSSPSQEEELLPIAPITAPEEGAPAHGADRVSDR